ncbi:hypothetical protein J5N97_006816 [Dioscorea zingiberensis]|uniref:Uncharacterized protein n=1 Tax=Dioscorea zingiberensis TaxID=325984 RepID=A0A9D5DAM3_9LILI|nr:hypothetical protein J5N97_006816 [Dioscorea zingiberensis]
MAFDGSSDDLMKVGVFILVQALVYLILSSSSDIFSITKLSSTLSFKSTRSMSMRRALDVLLSDLPPNGEPSPRPITSHI